MKKEKWKITKCKYCGKEVRSKRRENICIKCDMKHNPQNWDCVPGFSTK